MPESNNENVAPSTIAGSFGGKQPKIRRLNGAGGSSSRRLDAVLPPCAPDPKKLLARAASRPARHLRQVRPSTSLGLSDVVRLIEEGRPFRAGGQWLIALECFRRGTIYVLSLRERYEAPEYSVVRLSLNLVHALFQERALRFS